MKALILFSHGSLLRDAGQALEEHAERLRATGRYSAVEIGYLNYSSPPLSEAAERCAAADATRIVVVPYFLVPGKFVCKDLPAQVVDVRARHPQIEFAIAPPLGFDQRLAAAILHLARSAQPDRAEFGSATCEALLVMVHGSPRMQANDPMFAVVETVRSSGEYPVVEVGFLECNEPDIPTAIERCISGGASRIVAVPYFLHTGNHVTDDLPTLLEEARERHPGVEMVMSEFLGRAAELTDILAERAGEARSL